MDMFVVSRGERYPTDLASLRGARLVTAVETALEYFEALATAFAPL
jgi:phage/plasmid-associated DNA primase